MTKFVVTGAGRGIGLELSAQLLARGDSVLATFRDAAGQQRLEALEGALTLFRLDVRDDADVQRLVDALDAPLDVLVNNAGVMGVGEDQSVDTMNYAAWMEVLAVNTLAPFRLTTALLPHLRASDNPRVVTLSSIMGSLSRDSSGYYAYRSSKAAVNKVMRLLAHDLRDEGIVVCPVHPGWVQTEMGGEGAEVPVQESARGLIAWIDALTMASSGRFWQWDGTELPW